MKPVDMETFSQSSNLRVGLFVLLALAFTALFFLPGRAPLTGLEEEWVSALLFWKNSAGSTPVIPEEPNALIFGFLISKLEFVFGESEFIFRLLSLSAGIFTLFGSMLLGRVIFGSRSALIAGWLLISSCGFIYCSRIADSGIFAAAGMVWFAYVLFQKKKFGYWRLLALFLLFFITVCCCGAVPGAAMLIILLPRIFGGGEARLHLRFKISALAALLTAVVVIVLLCAGVLYFCRLSDISSLPENCGNIFSELGAFILRDLVSPYSGGEWEKALFSIPRMLLPWPLVSAAAIFLLCRSKLSGVKWQFFWAVPLIFCGIGIYPVRHWSDLLLLLPLICLLTAYGIDQFSSAMVMEKCELIMRGIFMLLASLICALLLTMPLWEQLLKISPPLLMMTLAPLLGFTALWLITFSGNKESRVGEIFSLPPPWCGTLTAGFLITVTVLCIYLPEMSMFRSGKAFWTRAAVKLRRYSSGKIIFFDRELDPEALYYLKLRWNANLIKNEKQLRDYIENARGEQIIVISRNSLEKRKILSAVFKEKGISFQVSEPQLREGFSLNLSAEWDDKEDEHLLWIIRVKP